MLRPRGLEAKASIEIEAPDCFKVIIDALSFAFVVLFFSTGTDALYAEFTILNMFDVQL